MSSYKENVPAQLFPHINDCHSASRQMLTKTSFKKRTVKSKLTRQSSTQNLLRETFRNGQRTNKLMKECLSQESLIATNPRLLMSILNLQDMKLLREKSLMITNYSQKPNTPVYNDYHSRETNPGYSRNKLGGFYTK